MFPTWVRLPKQWRPAEEPRLQGKIYRWPVYAETVRLRRLAGYLEFFPPEEESSPEAGEGFLLPESVIQPLKNLFRKKNRLREDRLLATLALPAAALAQTPEELAKALVAKGYLGRWVRLRPDEKSAALVEYGPLAPLTRVLQAEREGFFAENQKWYGKLKQKTEALRREAGKITSFAAPGTAAGAAGKLLDFLEQKGEEVKKALAGEKRDPEPGKPPAEKKEDRGKVSVHPLFPWFFDPREGKNRFHLSLEFLLVLTECTLRHPEGFAWKELGSISAPGIGGSKRFDQAREELLQLAEAITGVPPEELGLTSTGTLYPLYFLGRLTAFFAGAPAMEFNSTINALTNVQIGRLNGLSVPARRVVLTENRALLLKMETTGWQDRDPATLAVGLDGRLRLAHGNFLKLLAESRPELPWFAWVDTDEAGVAIARQVAEINPRCRFVLPPRRETRTPLPLPSWLAELEGNPALRNREQEENLGGTDLWNRLFKI